MVSSCIFWWSFTCQNLAVNARHCAKTTIFTSDSGKEKAHKHKQNFPVTARVGGVSRPGGQGSPGQGSPTGGQGSKVYVLCAEPKEHKHFRPGTRPGGSVTGVTEKLFMFQMFMCLFRPLVTF